MRSGEMMTCNGIPDLSSSCVMDCAGSHRWSWSPRRSDWHARNAWRARRTSPRRWTRTCAVTVTALCPSRQSRSAVCPLVCRALMWANNTQKAMLTKEDVETRQWLKQHTENMLDDIISVLILYKSLGVVMQFVQNWRRLFWRAVLEDTLDDTASVRMRRERQDLCQEITKRRQRWVSEWEML